MPLDKLIRDTRYFQDFRDQYLSNNNELARSIHFDDQFNEIVDFINNQLKVEVDSIAGGVIPGIEDRPNSFLRNIGDGNTEWAFLGNDSIIDFSLEFTKLVRATNPYCTILAANSDGIFNEVSTNDNNKILLSNETEERLDVPVWGKIRNSNITNATITGAKIGDGQIGFEHVIPGALINNFNNGITGDNFGDGSVTNEKMKAGTFVIDNFGSVPFTGVNVANAFNNTIQIRFLQKGTLTGDKIVDENILETHFNKVAFVRAGQLRPQEITDSKLINNRDPSGKFLSDTINPNFKATGQLLTLNYYEKRLFTPDVEAAFTANGC